MDSIYFYNGTTLTVNLFMPSVLNWTQRGITVTQTTTYPVSDTTTLTGHRHDERLVAHAGADPGLDQRRDDQRQRHRAERHHHPGQLRHPHPHLGRRRHGHRAAADARRHAGRQRQRQRRRGHLRPGRCCRGNYGNTDAQRPARPRPSRSITRTSTSALAFTATANGSTVNLGPFYDAHGYNYTVYWNTSRRRQPAAAATGCVNVGTGLVLGVQNMSTADGGLAVQWGDSGTADHNWVIVTDGNAVRFRNVNSGKVLGVENMSTADNARVLQWADNGTADHRWTLVDNGDGTYKIRNVNSGKLLGILNGSTARGAQAVQDADNGSADNRWRLGPQRLADNE